MTWWWQFWCNYRCTTDSIIKLGWEVKIRSIQEDDESKMYVGSLMIWVNPNCEVIWLQMFPLMWHPLPPPIFTFVFWWKPPAPKCKLNNWMPP